MSLPALLVFESLDLASLQDVSSEELATAVLSVIGGIQTDAVVCTNIPSIDAFLATYSALRSRAISVAVEDTVLDAKVVLYLARPETEVVFPQGFVSISGWWGELQASIVSELPELSWAGDQLPKQVIDLDELDRPNMAAKGRFEVFMRGLVQLPPKREQVQLTGGESPALAAVALDWFRPFLKAAWYNDMPVL